MDRTGEQDLPPELRHFQRAYGTSAAWTTGFGMLILPSVESYAEGYLITLRILLNERLEEPPEEMLAIEPVLNLEDDQRGQYRLLSYGGEGRDRRWFWTFRTAEAPDPRARELKVEVTGIRARRHGHKYPRPITDWEEKGPWVLAITLQDGSHRNSPERSDR